MRSFWLSTKKGKEAWIEPVVDSSTMTYCFEVRTGKGLSRDGTVGRGGDICLLTSSPIPREYIRAEGRSGRLGSRLMAIVVEGSNSRIYLTSTPEHEAVAVQASPTWRPTTEIPNTRYTTPVIYGMTTHGDLFTNRQLVALNTFCGLVGEARQKVLADSGDCEAYADALTTYLAFAVDKAIEYNCNLVVWFSKEDRPKGLFARQALSMVWDFAEPNPLCEIGGSFGKSVSIVADVLEKLPDEAIPGFAFSRSATEMNGANHFIISTDPPYYDNVPYADLSDFFYTWLRQMLQGVHPGLTATLLVPKAEELVAEPTRHGGRDEAKSFFEQGMRRVFHGMRNVVDAQFPATIYYAFKQAEGEKVDADEVFEGAAGRTSTGWETFLQGLVDTAWQVDGTWPLRTERTGRIRDNASNALASSIVLVCRPRQPDAPSASRRDFLSSLRRELPESLRNLQHGNIAPVDLAQAAIGPGMAVFSRYARVIEADGSPMTVRTALQLINQALDEVLAEQEGEFDSDTRWAIAWFDQYGVDEGPFGMAETLSKAKNTSVVGLSQAGILSAKGGKVRLLRRDELPEDWDPATDMRRTVWEVTQHLIRALETKGEGGAAALLRLAGERSERIGALERGFSSPTRSLIIVVSRHTRRKGNDHAQAQTQPTATAREDPTATAGSPRGDPGRDPGRPAADRNQTPRWARDPHRRRLQVHGAHHRGTDQPTVGPPDGRGDASRPRRLGEPAPGPLLGSRGGPHDQGSRPTRRHAADDVRPGHRPGDLLQPQL